MKTLTAAIQTSRPKPETQSTRVRALFSKIHPLLLMSQGRSSRFQFFHFPGGLGNDVVHRGQRLFKNTTMAYCQAARLKGAQLAGARQGQPFVPGGVIDQREQWLERAR